MTARLVERAAPAALPTGQPRRSAPLRRPTVCPVCSACSPEPDRRDAAARRRCPRRPAHRVVGLARTGRTAASRSPTRCRRRSHNLAVRRATSSARPTGTYTLASNDSPLPSPSSTRLPSQVDVRVRDHHRQRRCPGFTHRQRPDPARSPSGSPTFRCRSRHTSSGPAGSRSRPRCSTPNGAALGGAVRLNSPQHGARRDRRDDHRRGRRRSSSIALLVRFMRRMRAPAAEPDGRRRAAASRTRGVGA